MSKIGRLPIELSKNVTVEVKERVVRIQGPKGKLSLTISTAVEVKVKDSQIIVSRLSDNKFARSIYGTTRALLQNMVTGVVDGYRKELGIVGVGYKAQMKGETLILQIGFSHPVEIKVPGDLKVSVPAPTRIVVEGIDKHAVGQFAANVRRVYPPEPYKGKGIRYFGEVVRKKLGKALAK